MKLKDMMYYIDENAQVKVIARICGITCYGKYSCSYFRDCFESGGSPMFADREVKRIFPDDSSTTICVEIEDMS